MELRILVSATTLTALLSACGGGSGANGTDSGEVDGGANLLTISSADLSGYELTSTIVPLIGESDSGSGTLTVDDMTGTFNFETGTGKLAGGGDISFLATAADSVALFLAEPSTGSSRQGIIGVATPDTEIPTTGEAAYKGVTAVLIINESDIWELYGESTVQVDFRNGNAVARLSALDGTQYDGTARATSVTDVATIVFHDIVLEKGSLAGRSVSMTSSQIANDLSGSQSANLQGALYGSNAAALGAVFSVDDPGNIAIQGGLVSSR